METLFVPFLFTLLFAFQTCAISPQTSTPPPEILAELEGLKYVERIPPNLINILTFLNETEIYEVIDESPEITPNEPNDTSSSRDYVFYPSQKFPYFVRITMLKMEGEDEEDFRKPILGQNEPDEDYGIIDEEPEKTEQPLFYVYDDDEKEESTSPSAIPEAVYRPKVVVPRNKPKDEEELGEKLMGWMTMVMYFGIMLSFFLFVVHTCICRVGGHYRSQQSHNNFPSARRPQEPLFFKGRDYEAI